MGTCSMGSWKCLCACVHMYVCMCIESELGIVRSCHGRLVDPECFRCTVL